MLLAVLLVEGHPWKELNTGFMLCDGSPDLASFHSQTRAISSSGLTLRKTKTPQSAKVLSSLTKRNYCFFPGPLDRVKTLVRLSRQYGSFSEGFPFTVGAVTSSCQLLALLVSPYAWMKSQPPIKSSPSPKSWLTWM